ncbi:MAG TPA: YIP1 family protein [Ktedonobacteraceae bacterium]|jgi:hypothetical protein|nr:YIP1 family protein [Ktedonobacteraceae bacterium]
MAWNSEQAQVGRVRPLPTPRNPVQFLPLFYVQSILRPSARLFAHIAEYARWKLVWIQLLVIVLIPVVVGLLRILFHDTSTGVTAQSNIFLSSLSVITASASFIAFIVKIIAIPVFFFAGTALQFLVAKLLRGRGSYVSHCFSIQTYQIPLAIIGGLITLAFILLHFSTLFFSPLISIALFVYGIFINIAVVMGVHNINREKAIATVLVPYVVSTLAICGILAIIAKSIAGTINSIN